MTDQTAPPPPPAGAPVPHEQAPGMPGEAEPAKKSAGKKIISILGVVVVVLVVGFFKFGLKSLFADEDKTKNAKVGECVNLGDSKVEEGKETKVKSAEIVDCTSSKATYEVVGRFDDKTLAEAQSPATEEACGEYLEEGDYYTVFYSIPEGGKGYVLCLKQKA